MLIGTVIIGRNEGDRLIACLKSIPSHLPRAYVDSGSSDNSVEEAKQAGAIVECLSLDIPFTAARARNAGWRRLLDEHPKVTHVQFIDGDCELDSKWLGIATQYLQTHPDYAVVCGRRKEKRPGDSLYNLMCDIEWDTPIGDAKYCGGDAIFLAASLRASDGYLEELIAGEEPELCIRVRQQGYKIRRLDADMTFHDAALFTFSQWWRRTVRCGYAYANGAYLHGQSTERHWVKESIRAIVWSALLPLILLLAVLVNPLFYLGLAVYCVQWVRLVLSSPSVISPFLWASLMLLGKFAEGYGVVRFLTAFVLSRRSNIIEYK